MKEKGNQDDGSKTMTTRGTFISWPWDEWRWSDIRDQQWEGV